MGRMPVSDEELLRRTATDAGAFGAFYERHRISVFRYARWRMRTAEDAADLTAEVFAAALQAAPRFRAGSLPARAWLFGIANHKVAEFRRRGAVADRARRRLGMERLVFDDLALQRAEELADLPELQRSLEVLVRDLPVGERVAVLARVVDEGTYPEIADALGTSEQAVRQRVSRGLRRLESALRKEQL
jgi:RNA polymerase sigma factor (sigma-70 family)